MSYRFMLRHHVKIKVAMSKDNKREEENCERKESYRTERGGMKCEEKEEKQ